MHSHQKMVEGLQAKPEQLTLSVKLHELIERHSVNPDFTRKLQIAMSLLVTALQKKPKVIRILLCTYNSPDGIGDVINLVGFTRMLQSLFSGLPNIQIRGMAYVNSEKLPKLKSVLLASEERDFCFCELSGRVDKDSANNATITIISKPVEHLPAAERFPPSLRELLEASPVLNQFYRSCDFYLNIAVPFTMNNYPDHIVRSNRVVHSLLEIGLVRAPTDFQRDFPYLQGYPEVSMGSAKGEVGYKFDPTLLRFMHAVQNSRFDEIMQALNANQRLANILFPRGLVDASQLKYFSARNRLCVGYLQSTAANQIAAQLFMRSGDQKKNVVLICDLSAVKELLEKTPELKKSFCHINYHGEPTVLHALDTDAQRELTLIDFRGIAENTKFALFVLADMVLGSGDNSHTDTMLCRLPFWEIPVWKLREMSRFLEAIQEDYPTLYQYFLQQFFSAGWDYLGYEENHLNNMVKLLQTREQELVEEWEQFRLDVLENHNAEHYLQTVMLKFLNEKVDHPTSSQAVLNTLCDTIEKTNYSDAKYPVPVADNQIYQSLLRKMTKIHETASIAISNHDVQALMDLYQQFPYFSASSPWNLPLLPMAAQRQAAECLDFLLNQANTNPNDADTDTGRMTALHYAARNGDLKCAQRLLAHPRINRNILDAAGKNPLDYCRNNPVMTHLLQENMSGKKVTKGR